MSDNRSSFFHICIYCVQNGLYIASMSATTSSGLHSLATLIKRLEAAASRFEDIADLPLVLDPSAATRYSNPAIPGEADCPSLSPPPPPVPTIPTAPAPTKLPTETPKSVSAFQEDVINAKLKPFIESTQSFGGPNVIEVISLVQKQYDILSDFLKMAAACQMPDQKTLESLVTPFASSIEAISRAKEAYRRDRDWFSHLTLLGEGAPVIGWVVSPIPTQSVIDIKDSVVYYGNKLKQAYKDKDPKHADWVNSYVAIFTAMQSYVKEYHTTGLVWNPKGVTIEQYKNSSTDVSSAPGPPPPPPPPPPPLPVLNANSASPAGGAAAVFAELNRGEEVTKGLRKVDKSEMTHKNPALRASSVVPARSSSLSPPVSKKPTKPSKPQALAGKKPPRFLLDGNKWLIEFQETETLTVDNVEINQSVNIFGCKGTTIIINGKVNAINLINSSKTSILVQSVVSAVAVTASPSFQIQVIGSAPMIQLDSTDSGQIYLSKDSLHAEITTAKCSSININLPGPEEGEFNEQPVPEMFKTVVQNGKLVTTIVEHTG